MKYVYIVAGLLIVGYGLIIAVRLNQDFRPASPTHEVRIVQAGYFKDQVSNRVYAFTAAPGTSSAEIRAHAFSRPYTQGQMTAAYYFLDSSLVPNDTLTKADTLLEANHVLYESRGTPQWRYAYMRGFNGVESFVDCAADSMNALCRSAP